MVFGKKINFLLFFSFLTILLIQDPLRGGLPIKYRQGLALLGAIIATKEFQEFKKKYEREKLTCNVFANPVRSEIQDNKETHCSISWYEFSKLNFYFFKEYGKFLWRLMSDAILAPHISIKEKTAFTLMVWSFFLGEIGCVIYDHVKD